MALIGYAFRDRFQSTPPSREATVMTSCVHKTQHVSIHASLAGGDKAQRAAERSETVSIHASLAGGDHCRKEKSWSGSRFNPRLPRGRRPPRHQEAKETSRGFNPRLPRGRRPPFPPLNVPLGAVSIHASLAGGDSPPPAFATAEKCFNPRLPRGRRLLRRRSSARPARFQSTPPSREATWCASGRCGFRGGFNPRLPRGRRPQMTVGVIPHPMFQSTPPSREATVFAMAARCALCSFNPRLPRGRRRATATADGRGQGFQSTPPSREATSFFTTAWPLVLFQSTPPSREATARYSLILPLEHNIWEFLRICREGCCFSLTFVAEKRRFSTCFGANRPGKWAQLPLRTTGILPMICF